MRLRRAVIFGTLAAAMTAPAVAHSQASPVPPDAPASGYNPLGSAATSTSGAGALLAQPTLSPGALTLMELDRRFAEDVAQRGGKAFASWFAPDAVELSNKMVPVLGESAIAASATWDPAIYQLTWTPTAAQMGPSNDMGFTWGHYEGHSRDAHGQPVVVTGRYITVWKRLPDGQWKVALDASAQEPPSAGDCCALPKP